jgi:biopolymer transport protein ExbD
MQVPRLGEKRTVRFNVTPLIDVVFLLIVFFLVSSHLARQETQMELPLPTASSAQEPSVDRAPRVTVNVLADGRLLLGSDELEAAEIGRRLQVERRQTSGALEVRIRADHHVEYRNVEPLLLACARANLWNVSFSVTEKLDASVP